jgi:hypothetical protein
MGKGQQRIFQVYAEAMGKKAAQLGHILQNGTFLHPFTALTT